MRLANAFNASRNYDNASAFYEKAMELADVDGDTALLAKTLTAYGIMRVLEEDYEGGERNILHAQELAQKTNDSITIAHCHFHLGESKYFQGEFEHAIKLFEESNELAQGLEAKTLVSAGYNNLAQCQAELGNYELAEKLLTKAIHIRESLGEQYFITEYYTNLAYLHINQDSLEKLLITEHELFMSLYERKMSLGQNFTEPQAYVHDQLLAMNDLRDTELREAKTSNQILYWVIGGLILLLISSCVFLLRFRTQMMRANNMADPTQESQTSQPPQHPDSELGHRLEKLHSHEKNSHRLLVPCYILIGQELTDTEIGEALNRHRTRIQHYVSDMAEILNIPKEQVRQDAIRQFRELMTE